MLWNLAFTSALGLASPREGHVADATSRGIQQVNQITCLMSAMRPDALVNKGAYVALVDESKCDQRRASGGASAGQSDSAQAASYMTSIVDSTRASNSDPMRARMWISMEEGGFEATIHANMSVTAATSATTPYGVFRLDYCARADGMPGCMMRGYMDGATDGLSYYGEEPGGDGRTVALRLNSVGTESGSGCLQMTDEDGQMTYRFAYDATHFRRADADSDQCFSRDASDPDTGLSVWRYGLYDAATGARVERNSGFPIEYTADGHIAGQRRGREQGGLRRG